MYVINIPFWNNQWKYQLHQIVQSYIITNDTILLNTVTSIQHRYIQFNTVTHLYITVDFKFQQVYIWKRYYFIGIEIMHHTQVFVFNKYGLSMFYEKNKILFWLLQKKICIQNTHMH